MYRQLIKGVKINAIGLQAQEDDNFVNINAFSVGYGDMMTYTGGHNPLSFHYGIKNGIGIVNFFQLFQVEYHFSNDSFFAFSLEWIDDHFLGDDVCQFHLFFAPPLFSLYYSWNNL